jgi:hypothetical protein
MTVYRQSSTPLGNNVVKVMQRQQQWDPVRKPVYSAVMGVCRYSLRLHMVPELMKVKDSWTKRETVESSKLNNTTT